MVTQAVTVVKVGVVVSWAASELLVALADKVVVEEAAAVAWVPVGDLAAAGVVAAMAVGVGVQDAEVVPEVAR